MTPARRPLKARTLALALAFGAVALVLTLSAATTIHLSRSTLREVDEIASNTIVSVELLGRMASDVYQEQKLVSDHIYEATTDRMLLLEQRIDVVRADYAAAAHAYEPLTTFPKELDAWRQLEGDVDRSHGPIAEALRLSRQNRDAEAQRLLLAVEPTFDDINRDVATSVAINRADARHAQLTAERLHHRSLFLQLLFWCAGIGLTLAVGILMTRQIARAEQRERQAFDVLEKRNRELDAFAGRVAHDFRGPLTTVKTAASALSLSSPDVPRHTATIHRGIQRMTAMIDDLLQLSQIEGAERSDVCDPAAVAQTTRDNLAERFAGEGATIELAVAAARVRCREGLFQQVLANLVENAVKYRRPEIAAAVGLAGRVDGAMYELRVSDNGIGMSSDEVTHVFDPLFRARRLRDTAGTGLGLSIVKRIVEAYGGSASVESKLGVGSTFIIRLPLA